MNLGDKIRTAREARGLKQEELADELGIAARTLSNWERGTARPRSKIGALERALHVRLRVDNDTDGDANTREPRLRDATIAQLLTELAGRFAERDARIDELLSGPLPPRWAARSRGDDNDDHPDDGDERDGRNGHRPRSTR